MGRRQKPKGRKRPRSWHRSSRRGNAHRVARILDRLPNSE